MSDNRWIISAKNFHEHKKIEAAEAELARLQEICPEKQFRIYRVKRSVPGRSDGLIKLYLETAIAGFEVDLPDCEFAQGYLAALDAVYEDNFLTQAERAERRAAIRASVTAEAAE